MLIREASRDDIEEIYAQIYELAEFVNTTSKITITKEGLEKLLFDENDNTAIIAEIDGKPVGIAIYGHITFNKIYHPTNGIFIDKLYVKPEYRKQKVGYNLFKKIVEKAKSIGCQRIEWHTTRDNTLGNKFYEKLGAIMLENVAICRLSGEHLKNF